MTVRDDEDELNKSVMIREHAANVDSGINFDVYALEKDEEGQIADKTSDFKFNCQAVRDAKLSDKNKSMSYHKLCDETLTESFRDSTLLENQE